MKYLKNERVVNREEGKKLIFRYGIKFYKYIDNEVFQYLIYTYVEIYHYNIINVIKKNGKVMKKLIIIAVWE